MLEKVNPTVKDALNTLADVATSDNEIIEEYLDTIKDKIYNDDSILSHEYRKLSKPVKMRIIHDYIQRLNLDYDYKKIAEIYSFIEENIVKRNGSTVSLSASSWLYVDDKIIETLPRKCDIESRYKTFEPFEITDEGEYSIGDRILTLKSFVEKDIFVFPESTASFVYVDLSQITLPITVRTRAEGDIITPFGMTGTMKLKKYFNSKGISRHTRDEIVLLTQGNDVLWAVGVGISNKIGVTTKPTHVIEIK